MRSDYTVAICGLGSAGRARLKALDAVPGFRLHGIISRHQANNLSWEQALLDPRLDLVAISTETTRHASLALEALSAGKHVLCDYPLATDGASARALYHAASDKKLLLHTEHMSLLSPSHHALKAALQQLGTPLRGMYRFTGGWNDKLANPAYRGPRLLMALPRLLQIADCLGDFQIRCQALRETTQGLSFQLELTSPTVTIDFFEERQIGLARQRSFKVEAPQGQFNWQGTAETGLFTADLAYCYRRLQERLPCYYDEELMLKLLEQLTDLEPAG